VPLLQLRTRHTASSRLAMPRPAFSHGGAPGARAARRAEQIPLGLLPAAYFAWANQGRQGGPPLTEEEYRVLKLSSPGCTIKEIAANRRSRPRRCERTCKLVRRLRYGAD
jgi:hypothetical protein